MADFSWKDIYEEVSKELLEYKNKQDKLLDLMEKFVGLTKEDTESIKKVINDARKEENKNKKIDPFTFFAYLSKGSKKTPEFLKFLKKEWGLKNKVPTEYDAFQYTHSGGEWWYFHGHERDTVPKLWVLFEDIFSGKALTKKNTGFIPAAKRVSWKTITKGFYWIKPSNYICTNDVITKYLKASGIINTEVNSLKEYKKIINSIKKRLGKKSFMQITYEALSSEQKYRNKIFFGPPGTGKTHKIIEIKKERETEIYKEVIKKMDPPLFKCIIVAMLDLGDEPIKVPELVKHPIILAWNKGKAATIGQKVSERLQKHAHEKCEGVKKSSRDEPQCFWKEKGAKWRIVTDLSKDRFPDLVRPIQEEIKIQKNYEFVTFHQSFSYEDFIEGIKPGFDDESNDLNYRIEKGVFLRLAEKARNDSDNDYTLFIDEINRGNISSIFGELITLIEEDKREGCANEVKVKLPYSKEEFTVPKNLSIVATMNTADRSVESLDSALRRRFEFVEFPPRLDIVDESIEEDKENKINPRLLLETINERLLVLIGKDKLIGHSYFMNINSVDDLVRTFKNKIIPLLEEYFYNDRQKILMVLGPKFVTKREWKKEGLKFFGSTDDLEDVITYEFTESDNWNNKAFRSIYKEADETNTDGNTGNKQDNIVDDKK